MLAVSYELRADARMVQVLSSTLMSLQSSPDKIGSWPLRPTLSFFLLITTSSCFPRVPLGTGTSISTSESCCFQVYGRART